MKRLLQLKKKIKLINIVLSINCKKYIYMHILRTEQKVVIQILGRL